jgi:hypothetical protein
MAMINIISNYILDNSIKKIRQLERIVGIDNKKFVSTYYKYTKIKYQTIPKKSLVLMIDF